MKFLLVIMSLFVLNAQASENTFRNQVVPSFEYAFSAVKSRPVPPPRFAYLMSLAVECGERAQELSFYEKPFTLAFLLTLETLEPKWKGLVDDAVRRSVLPRTKLSEAISAVNRQERRWYADKNRAMSLASGPLRVGGIDDGEWRPTPPQFSAPVLPKWGSLLNEEVREYEALMRGLNPPHIFSPVYYKELDEVAEEGNKRNYNRRFDDIAHFWAAGGGSVTPPGMWMEAGLKALSMSRYSDAERITILKGLTSSLSYAGIMAWKVKYKFNTWRPLTAIRKSGSDMGWTPRLETPPFPSYVSGHSTFNAAGAVFLEAYGLKHLTFRDEKGRIKNFSSPWKAALEAGKSRIYGGIHYEADNADGLELGKRVACKTLKLMKRRCL